jgi:hypothetical protein
LKKLRYWQKTNVAGIISGNRVPVDLFQFDSSFFKRFDLQIWFVMRFSKDSICGFDLWCGFQKIQFEDSICKQKMQKDSIHVDSEGFVYKKLASLKKTQ